MAERIDSKCPSCGEETIDIQVSAAAHDESLLDIIAECNTEDGGCGTTFNAFLPMADFQEVA